jgi:2-(1,2-epoxy-1,2-dihydrophenyl)acetyl-CoA isomerase
MNDVKTSVADGVAQLTVNRPAARNALRPETMDAMMAFLQAVEQDLDIGAVILGATGEHFVSGGDVKNFAYAADRPAKERGPVFEALVHRMNPLLKLIERMPQIVIASVRGYVAGSGVSLVGAADLAIASENARFLVSHIKIAGVPDAGITYYLPRQVGVKRAKEILLLGEPIDAQEALRIGLINRIVPDDALEAEALRLAARFGTGPRRSLAETKRLADISFQNSLAGQLMEEAGAVGRATSTEDFVEGVTAFAQKRAPSYKGR